LTDTDRGYKAGERRLVAGYEVLTDGLRAASGVAAAAALYDHTDRTTIPGAS
jgi:hypothetical protein